LYPFVDIYANTHVTDLLFNIFDQYSATDSKHWTTYREKYLQKIENNLPVDYTKEFEGIYILNQKYRLDPFAVWINRCQDIGINPWISIRMNDCHCPDEDTCWLRSDFFYEAQEKGWMLGDAYGYYRKCFNYKIPQVREKMLAYIEEQLFRYDVYGIDLDFMREIFCFDYLKENMDECVLIMNDFMRSVKEISKRAEAHHKHEIKIAVRLTRDIEQSLAFGFDARTWAKEQLVDVIIPSPRFRSSDSDMPIPTWKTELPGISVCAGIEMLVSFVNGLKFTTAEIVRGLCAKYLSDGADGIYLFNYFVDPGESGKFEKEMTVFNTCGSLEQMQKLPMRYVLIEQESDMCPAGFTPWQPLPLTVDEKETKLFLKTAEIPAGKCVYLIVGFSVGSPKTTKIRLNGDLCTDYKRISLDLSDCMETPQPTNYISPDTLCYAFKPDTVHPDGRFELSFSSSEPAKIEWIEITMF